MILTCPNCTTQFSVKAGALGTRGRKVKCSRCSHQWFQMPESAEEVVAQEISALAESLPDSASAAPAPPTVEPSAPAAPYPVSATGQKSSKPAAPKPAGIGLKLVAGMCIVLALLGIALAATPFLGHHPVLAKLGFSPTRDYALRELGMAVTPGKDGKISLSFSGHVENNSANLLPSPTITILLYDALDREMRTLHYSFPLANIEAGKTLPFEPKINNIPDSLARVVLELGNPAEQFLR